MLLWLHGERRLLHALGLLWQGCEAAGSVPSSEATTGSPTLDVSSTLVRKSGREKKHRRRVSIGNGMQLPPEHSVTDLHRGLVNEIDIQV